MAVAGRPAARRRWASASRNALPGGVVALARAADDAGGRGEEHERRQVQIAGQFVEVERGGGLAAQYRVHPARVEGVDHAVVECSGGVEDGVQRVFGRHVGQQVPQGVAVGDVARGDGHPYAQLREFRAQFLGARCGGAAAAGEQQVLGAAAGQPAGDMPADRPGAAGDQYGAARAPGLGDGLGGGGPGQPAAEDAGGAQCDLVLTAGVRQGGAQPGRGPGVEGRRQVDQTAPAVRVLQRRDPSEAPDHRLGRAGDGLRAGGGDRATGGAPQPRVGAGVAECLYEGERPGESERYGGVLGVRAFVQGEQREHSGDPGRLVGLAECGTQPVGQPFPAGVAVEVAVGEGDQADVADSAALQGQSGLLGQVGVVAGVGRCDQQPGAGQGARAAAGQRRPADGVAPRVGGGLLPAGLAPGGQRGQEGTQGRVAAEVQGAGEGLQVLLFDGLPEPRLHGVRGQGAGRRRLGRGLAHRRPVALPLEGVGRQVDPGGAAAGEDRGPLDGHAADVRLGQRGEELVEAALVAAQRAEYGGVDAGVLDGLAAARRRAPGAGSSRRTTGVLRRSGRVRPPRTGRSRAGCGTSTRRPGRWCPATARSRAE